MNEATTLHTIVAYLQQIGYDRDGMRFEPPLPGAGRADLLYKKDRIHFVLEAKKPGAGADTALSQAIRYAHACKAPICIATDWHTYLHTWHCARAAPLTDESGAPITLATRHRLHAANFPLFKKEGTLSSRVKSSVQLEKIFAAINTLAMKMGVSVGEKRVEEVGKLIFLKMLADNDTVLDDRDWRYLRQCDSDAIVGAANGMLRDRVTAQNHFDVPPLQVSPAKGRIVAQILALLDDISFKSDYYDYNSTLFQRFISGRSRGKTNDLGQYFTPPHLVDLLYNLADYQKNMTVHDPCCGVGGILGRVFTRQSFHDPRTAKRFGKDSLFGTEKNPEVATLAHMNMIIMGDSHTNIKTCDALDPEENPFIADNVVFDRVITNIPFAPADPPPTARDYFRLAENCGGKACFIEHCLNRLRADGKAVIIVPKGFLDEQKSAPFRRRLLEKYDLEAVYQLYSGTFHPYTLAHSAILVINKSPGRDRIRFQFLRNEADMQALAQNGAAAAPRAQTIAAAQILTHPHHSYNGESYRPRTLLPSHVRLADLVTPIPDSDTVISAAEARLLPKVTTPNDIEDGINLVPARATKIIAGEQGSFTQRIVLGALVISRIVNGKNMYLGSCQANQPGIITKEYHQLTVKNPAHMPYLLYAIRGAAFQEICYTASGTGGQQRVHLQKLLQVQLPTPTPPLLARARASMERIESLSAQIDALKQQCRAEAAKIARGDLIP